MNKLCTICARGGSVGVKNKNIKLLQGKPLIAHSILQAKQSQLFDKIAVSSDSQAILDIASEYGADLLIERPHELASNDAAKIPAIQHAVNSAEAYYNKKFTVIVDLDATSPLRTVSDIQSAVDLLKQNKNVITAMKARRSPYFNLIELDQDKIPCLSKKINHSIVRRQDSPECFDMNASIYVWERDYLLADGHIFTANTALYVMPEERSIDIDSELDFEIVAYLASKRGDLF